MTIFQHVVHGYLLGKFITGNDIIAGIMAVIGGLPDIIGEIGKYEKIDIYDANFRKVGYKWRRDSKDWTVYNFWHKFEYYSGFKILLLFVPSYLLHLFLDNFWHKPMGGWYKWGVYAEVLGWIVCAFLFYKI